MSQIAADLSLIAQSFGGLRCHHALRIRESSGWRIGAHSHPFYEMLIFFSGRHRIRVAGEEILCEAGDAVLYPPGRAHAEAVAAPGTEWVFVGFEWPQAPPSLPLRFRDAAGRGRILADWLGPDSRSSAKGHEPSRDVLLSALIMQLFGSADAEEDDMVRRTRELFQKRLAEPLRLDMVARHARRSKFHFLRLYRKRTGRTPMEDLRIMRLERARELLLTTGLPLKAIAPRCGLGDEYRLSRLFRKHFGAPPGTFRVRAPNAPARNDRPRPARRSR